jgi:hypothetical protein
MPVAWHWYGSAQRYDCKDERRKYMEGMSMECRQNPSYITKSSYMAESSQPHHYVMPGPGIMQDFTQTSPKIPISI